MADRDGRIVVTRDDDFVHSFLLRNTPQRLMLVASGNIGNAELERLIIAALPTIIEAFATAHYIEIGRNSVIVHEEMGWSYPTTFAIAATLASSDKAHLRPSTLPPAPKSASSQR